MPEIFQLFFRQSLILLRRTEKSIKKIPRSFIIPIIVFTFGLIFLGIGLIQYIFNLRARENIKRDNFTDSKSLSHIQASDFTSSAITPQIKTVSVDVEGAVQNPGLYSLGFTSHVQDGLIAAGGFNVKADRIWIAKNLNLAANITDGMKIYIPRIGEQVEGTSIDTTSTQISLPESNSEVQAGSAKSSGKTKKGKPKIKKQKTILGTQTQNIIVNINTASADELSTLPGIKGSTAKKIISRRPYASLDDLLKKKAVSKKTFAKIKDMIIL